MDGKTTNGKGGRSPMPPIILCPENSSPKISITQIHSSDFLDPGMMLRHGCDTAGRLAEIGIPPIWKSEPQCVSPWSILLVIQKEKYPKGRPHPTAEMQPNFASLQSNGRDAHCSHATAPQITSARFIPPTRRFDLNLPFSST